MDLQSGFCTIRKRKLPILWTGQYAQHLAEEHISDSTSHPFLHIEAQKHLQKGEVLKNKAGYICLSKLNNQTVLVPVIVKPNFVIIKTAYAVGGTAANYKQNNMGSTRAKYKKSVEWNETAISKCAAEIGMGTEELKQFVLKNLNKKKKACK